MESLLLHIFFAFGLAYVVGYSKITLGVRTKLSRIGVGMFLVELMECPACLGFWIGFITGEIKDLGHVLSLVFAFFTAGTNFAIGRLTGLIKD